MRFKHLTATMLRECAMRIYEDPNYICWTLESFGNEAKREMEELLIKMGVSTSGWLNFVANDVRTNHYCEFVSDPNHHYHEPSLNHPAMIEMRVMFLLMLADAIAYKPKRSKFDGSNKPFSENPSEPGVYAVVNRRGKQHYSKWDGRIWFMTDDTASDANQINMKSYDIYNNRYDHWINTKLL